MLTDLLFGAYRKKVLGLLLLHPDTDYHVRELARQTGTAPGTLHKELARLATAGLLLRKIHDQVRTKPPAMPGGVGGSAKAIATGVHIRSSRGTKRPPVTPSSRRPGWAIHGSTCRTTRAETPAYQVRHVLLAIDKLEGAAQ